MRYQARWHIRLLPQLGCNDVLGSANKLAEEGRISVGDGVAPAGWAEKGALVFSSVPVGLAFSALSPVLPKMVTAFAAYPNAPVLVKQLVGIIGLSMVIGCPLGGWLARRVNHRLLIGLGYL